VDKGFHLFPESASSVAERVDGLFLFLVAVAAVFVLLICVLILYFGVRYRRGSKASRANPPHSNWLEVGWAIPPFLLSMVMFVWGAVLYFEIKTPPADALEVSVVGKQWMWKVQHEEGKSEINTLHLPLGQPVKLRMISEDVIHSFYIPAFRVKQDVLPGYYTSLWFEPIKEGEYHLFCAEYCGTEHSQMRGRVIVMKPADYEDWISGETGEPPAVAGEKLFGRFRCSQCHKPDGSGAGPSLEGVYGSQVPLQGGGTVTADEQYLRNSIRNPAQQIVAGRKNLMPAFDPKDLSEADILKLIAYIKSLKKPATD